MATATLSFVAAGVLGCHPAGDSCLRGSALDVEVPSTYSIVALDPATGDLGVAVASRFLAVGAVVPWAEEGVGAIATQSYANTSYGPKGLRMLREGSTPQETAEALLGGDPERDFRQLGIVDARGRTYASTGKRCLPWAGSRTGENVSAQGNILVSEKTVDAMVRTFLDAKGELSERLLQAVEAGEEAGGDARGRQSAALLVVRKNGGYGGFSDRYVDLRVDDHHAPVAELRRLLQLHMAMDPASRARKIEGEGRREEALSLLEEALRRNPSWNVLRLEVAGMLLRAGNVEGARAHLQIVITSDPLEANYYFRAARILAETGRNDEALEMLRKTLALNAEYSHVLRRELDVLAGPFRALRDRIEALLQDKR